MMTDMVERVAKAIMDAQNGETPKGYGVGEWDRHSAYYERAARAAIGAMREPTEAQLNNARDWSAAKYGKPIGNDAATGCWQAMIYPSQFAPAQVDQSPSGSRPERA